MAENEPESTFSYIRSWMGVPLIVKGRLIGMVSLDHYQPDYYSQDHSSLLMAFAELAAIAIENARLYERAQQSAAEKERNRLARDLHDAVTQTLFSASLIADILPRLWERDPEQGKQRLEELRDLTRGALAEMRTLLMELRPATLTERSLGKLLRQLTQAVGGRSRISIELIIEGDSPLPPKIQVALYRMVQESLNNVIKHAAANHAVVWLAFHPDHVYLSVKDDGQGFDPAKIPIQSLGLGILRERASRIDAGLEINSEIGTGTEIVIRCPLNLSEDAT